MVNKYSKPMDTQKKKKNKNKNKTKLKTQYTCPSIHQLKQKLKSQITKSKT